MMKLVIGISHGGFYIDDDLAEECGIGDIWWNRDEMQKARTNKKLIETIESEITYDEDGEIDEYPYDLNVVNIPDNVSDWYVTSDDGEEIIYVLDGKIHLVDAEGEEYYPRY